MASYYHNISTEEFLRCFEPLRECVVIKMITSTPFIGCEVAMVCSATASFTEKGDLNYIVVKRGDMVMVNRDKIKFFSKDKKYGIIGFMDIMGKLD